MLIFTKLSRRLNLDSFPRDASLLLRQVSVCCHRFSFIFFTISNGDQAIALNSTCLRIWGSLDYAFVGFVGDHQNQFVFGRFRFVYSTIYVGVTLLLRTWGEYRKRRSARESRSFERIEARCTGESFANSRYSGEAREKDWRLERHRETTCWCTERLQATFCHQKKYLNVTNPLFSTNVLGRTEGRWRWSRRRKSESVSMATTRKGYWRISKELPFAPLRNSGKHPSFTGSTGTHLFPYFRRRATWDKMRGKNLIYSFEKEHRTKLCKASFQFSSFSPLLLPCFSLFSCSSYFLSGCAYPSNAPGDSFVWQGGHVYRVFQTIAHVEYWETASRYGANNVFFSFLFSLFRSFLSVFRHLNFFICYKRFRGFYMVQLPKSGANSIQK